MKKYNKKVFSKSLIFYFKQYYISTTKLSRLILFFALFFFFSITAHSQEIRVGVSGVSQGFIETEDTIFCNATGGSVFTEVTFNGSFGESIRFQYCQLFSKENIINSAQQYDFLAGLWGRIPFLHSSIFLQPSVEAGLVYQIVELSGESEMPEGAYTDLLIQFGLGFHFIPEKLLNGSIDFEITPVYTFIPMKSKAFQCGGASIGVSYIIK